MTCGKCNNDLERCICPDLPERLESIKSCRFIHIGEEYLARIEKQALKVKNEKTITE